MEYTMQDGVYPDDDIKDKNIYYKGKGWSVKKLSAGFLLEYLSGEHRGGSREIKITGEDFNLLRTGHVKVDDICIKYGIS
jgi:hypothetical protein